MILVNFKDIGDIPTIYGLWQYDYGQLLELQGIDIADGTSIHFAQGGKTIEGIIRSSQVEIPDYFLQFPENISVYVYIENEDSGETVAKAILHIRSRDRPPDYTTPDQPSYTRLLPTGWEENEFLTVKNGELVWIDLNKEYASDEELAQVAQAIPEFATMKEIEDILNMED